MFFSLFFNLHSSIYLFVLLVILIFLFQYLICFSPFPFCLVFLNLSFCSHIKFLLWLVFFYFCVLFVPFPPHFSLSSFLSFFPHQFLLFLVAFLLLLLSWLLSCVVFLLQFLPLLFLACSPFLHSLLSCVLPFQCTPHFLLLFFVFSHFPLLFIFICASS